MCDNIGVRGVSPSVYVPTGDADLADIFLVSGGAQCVYPVADVGHDYAGVTDQKFFFSWSAEGVDVDPTVAIDAVGVTFYGALGFGQTIRPYFKTGGVKYYAVLQQGLDAVAVNTQYGNGHDITLAWSVNPATLLPWTLAQVTAGEFGFETSASFELRAAFVEIFWGYGLTAATGPGATPAAAPCGQTATLASAFTNFEAKILEITPGYGPLAGGTQIVIRGYNFVTGATVTVGGLPATGVQYVDDQHYVATVPAHAVGFTDVVINEPLGTSVVYKNGFQYTLFTRGEDIRRTPGVSIRMGLNSGANTCTFQVDGESNPPRVGEKIQIIDEFVTPRRLLFAGNAQSVEQIYEGLNTQLAWNVTAVDPTWFLNRRRPFGEYHNTSASDIVKDLILKYAPGFTTNFVQTNLAKVSIAFDGSWDLQTCLSVLARMIGGGHWYVFTQDLHFFHVIPPDVNLPTSPVAAAPPTSTGAMLRVGTASAPTVAQGALFGNTFSFTPGIYFFQVTFVYDNGTESAFGPATCVALDGLHAVTFSNIPVGAALGSLTCVKRRIYVKANGVVGGGKRAGFAQVDDNVTTGFTTVGFAPQATGEIANVSSMIGTIPPAEAVVSSPAYTQPSAIPLAAATVASAALCQPEYRPAGQNTALTWSPGPYHFKVIDIYQDLTESKAGPATASFTSEGTYLVALSGIPVGVSVNGVSVIARRIVGAYGTSPQDSDYRSWWIVPNNTATAASIAPTTGGTQGGTTSASTATNIPAPETSPVWPNADGPYLEDFDLPGDVTDDNPDLLRDPKVTSRVDMSQIRNRILIRGAGSSTTSDVAAGASTIPVSDCVFYASSGGQVFVEGQILTYTGVSAASGPGSLTIKGTVGEPVNSGAPVALYLMVEDKVSQDDMGRVELDVNGRPTDGIHEYVIVDGSLDSPFQMFMRGYAELELYARPITTVQYATRDARTRPGALVTISLTNPPISGVFLIQDVMIDQIHNEADDLLEPRYNVTTSSNRFDLNDLFFQWATKTSNPNSGAGGSAGPAPSTSGLAQAVINQVGPSSGDSGARYFIGVDVDSTTEFKWLISKDAFATYASSGLPDQTPADPDLGSTIGGSPKIHVGVSFPEPSPVYGRERTWFVYPSNYARGLEELPRLRRVAIDPLDGTMDDAALFTVPSSTKLTARGFSNAQWAATPARIADMLRFDWAGDDGFGGRTTVAKKLYFIAHDFVGNAVLGTYSRVMEYDLLTGVIRQIGQGCNNSGTNPGEIGAGAVAFTSLGRTPDGVLLAGVGCLQTGFNSTDAGIWSIDPVNGTTWVQEVSLTSGAVGETPLCFGNHVYLSFCGLTRLDAGTARMLVRSPTGAWTESTSFGTGINNAWTCMHQFFTIEGTPYLFATSYENLGGTDGSKIWKYNGNDHTWSVVRTIETAVNPAIGVSSIQQGSNTVGENHHKLFFLCVGTTGRGAIASTDDGFSWTVLSGLTGATSVFGLTGGNLFETRVLPV